MAIKETANVNAYTALAKIWWRKIKAGSVLFAECPTQLHPDVIILVRADVASGIITAEEYAILIGEEYER